MSSIAGQDVILADQAGYPTFIVNAFLVASALNKNMFQIFNANAGQRIFIHSLTITNEQQVAVTGVLAQYEIGRSTALATGSTTVTPGALDSTKTLPASITTSTGGAATVAVTYGRELISTDEWTANTTDAESLTAPLFSTKNLLAQMLYSRPAILNLNEGLVVNCLTNTTTGLHNFCCIFSVGA